MKIVDIKPRWILDSRGNPTVECDVRVDSGELGRASVPSGASVGKYEAIELRDSDTVGVLTAIENIKTKITPVLLGRDVTDQKDIDATMRELDGTDNKSNLGANAMLAVSLACAHAGAAFTKNPLYEYLKILANSKENVTLPMPMVNVINGGKHAGWTTDIQEYMIVPIGAKSFSDSVVMATDVFRVLKDVLKEHEYLTLVGDEGGYAPKVSKGNNEPLELLSLAIEKAGYEVGKDISFALDIAASEFYKNGVYELKTDTKSLSSSEMIDWLVELTTQFPFVSLEDALDQDDWEGWKNLTEKLGDTIQLVGDDLFVTNIKRIQKGIDEHAANAVLIKPNQIGTLSETLEAIKLAKEHRFNTIISHRSGETNDVTIAHIAVGVASGQIKCGSVSRGERVAKYNELLRIEEELGSHAAFLNPFIIHNS